MVVLPQYFVYNSLLDQENGGKCIENRVMWIYQFLTFRKRVKGCYDRAYFYIALSAMALFRYLQVEFPLLPSICMNYAAWYIVVDRDVVQYDLMHHSTL